MTAWWRIAVLASTACVVSAAYADPVSFKGRTSADATLIRDVLHDVEIYGQSRWKCSSVSNVDSQVMAGFKPTASGPEGSTKAIYERWIVTACGRRTAFLVTFWGASDGGVNFGLREFAGR